MKKGTASAVPWSYVALLLGRGHWREALVGAFEQGDKLFPTWRTIVDGEEFVLTVALAPKGYARVSSVLPKNVVLHVEILKLLHVVVVVPGNALQGVDSGFFWGHAVTHILDDRVRTADF